VHESTAQELLRLSADHSELRAAYASLQSNAQHHDNIVQLVHSELHELSAVGELLAAVTAGGMPTGPLLSEARASRSGQAWAPGGAVLKAVVEEHEGGTHLEVA
jgi:hypothetical protein